jgi:putative flippase GtrA
MHIKPPLIIEHLLKYGLVGGVGALLDMGVFFLGFHVLSLPYLLANLISSHCGIINNFLMNSFFTFKISDRKLRRFISYYLIALVGIGLSSILLVLFIGTIKLQPLIAKVAALAIVTSAQFMFNRSVTFKRMVKK